MEVSVFSSWMTLLCVLGIVITIVIIISLIKYYSIGKEKEREKIEYKDVELQNKLQLWFDGTIKEYTEKVLAWQINEICLKQNIPMSVVDKIREKYGNEAVCPELNLRGKFDKYKNDKKLECLYGDLEGIFKQWLKNNNIEFNNTQYEKNIAEAIIAKSEEDAQKIIDEYMSNKQEV